MATPLTYSHEVLLGEKVLRSAAATVLGLLDDAHVACSTLTRQVKLNRRVIGRPHGRRKDIIITQESIGSGDSMLAFGEALHWGGNAGGID
jgi:hypothetical protein